MDKNIEFTIEFKDKATGVVSQMNLSLKDADEVIRQVRGSIEGLSGDLVNAGQSTQAFSAAMDVLRQVDGTIKGLAQGYNDYAVAEARLTQVMRNTMDASDDEIRSIVDLCSAQEKLGVVEDDVAMAGAQELGTYLGLSSSLQTLIPVLNDMLAQQYGVNATQESAVAIATMLGKVMEGQTSALSRYGYSFDEVQEKILKFGTEEEKAATLAAVVSESVGGMNAALADTDPGRMKQLQMEIDGVKDKLGKITQGALPFLDIASQTGIALMGVMQLGQGLKAMTVHLKGSAVAAAAAAVHDKVLTAARTMLSAATKGAVVSTGALTVAVTALYAALTLGISAAITGIVALLSSLGNKAEDSSKQLESLSDAQDAFSQASGDATSHIELEISKLKTLIDAKMDTRQAVADLNSEYGKTFGTYGTAAQWYDVLKSKSAAYCQQLGYEAKAKSLASKIAETELEMEAKKRERDNLQFGVTPNAARKYSQLSKEIKELDTNIGIYREQFNACTQKMAEATQTLSDGKGDFDAATASYDALKNEIDLLDTQLKSLAPTEVAEINRIRTKRDEYKKLYDAMGKRLGLDKGSGKDEFSGKSLIANAASYKAIGNNITYYKTQLEKLDPAKAAEVARISEIIRGLEEQQRQVKLLMDASTLEAATESSSLDVINQNIAFQQELRKTASKDNIAAIDAEIRRLNDLKEAVEDAGFQVKALGDIRTYEELAQQLQHYEKQLQKTSGTEREAIQKHINDLKELKRGWDDALAAMNKPGDISTLSTIQDLSDAISYYSARQKKASADEIVAIQRTINQLEKKKAALTGLTELPAMQDELSGLGKFSGEKLTLELELIGLDGIKNKIRSLNKMLADTKNPLDSKQRKEVENMVTAWEGYEKQLKASNADMRTAWGGIKGIAGGVRSITDALNDQENAWDAVHGIIDGVLSIYDGFKTVIGLINMLTAVSSAHTTAKTLEAEAEVAEAATTTAGATTTAAAVAANTTALGIETAAWSALSAAKTFAAHASIPFYGTVVAAGFIAAQQATIIAAAIPKFADGGLAYGPTLGIFGEYANAGHNPEVVAPLDRLQALLGIGGSGKGGKVKFEIKGRRLVGVMEKEYNYRRRS